MSYDWEEIVKYNEIQQFEKSYYEKLQKGETDFNLQFDYACRLVRSIYPADIKKGILFLEILCSTNPSSTDEYLYNLTVGNVRLKEYSKALVYIRCCIVQRPENKNFQILEKIINRQLKREAVKDILISGIIFATYIGIFFIALKIHKK